MRHIQIKYTFDDNWEDDSYVKCLTSYKDFALAVFELKQLMINFNAGTEDERIIEEVERFKEEFYEIIKNLPELS